MEEACSSHVQDDLLACSYRPYLAALVVPGVAQAHHTAVPIVALDYANRILPGAAGPDGVHATLDDAGRKLRLTVAPGRQAVVLGYVGEPFLRFDSHGVSANAHSETAQGSAARRGRGPRAA